MGDFNFDEEWGEGFGHHNLEAWSYTDGTIGARADAVFEVDDLPRLRRFIAALQQGEAWLASLNGGSDE